MMIPGYDSPTLIGRGGFAHVYRAHQQAFDRQVAVKILLVSLDEPRDRRRFERECAAMGRLTGHPHIVTVLESGVTPDGHPYLTMPYYAAGTLASRIAAYGPSSVDETLTTGVALAGALDLAHANGILHRDVKPANVLLSDYGEPALADFGIAVITAERAELSQVTHAFTITHAPPETLDGHPATEATDVYSLASTLWTMLTGEPPFGHDDGQGLAPRVERVKHQPVPPLVRADVPPDLEAALRDALAKDPRARPSARRLGERLQGVQRERGDAVTPLRSGAAATAAAPAIHGDPPTIRWADDSVASPLPQPPPPPAHPPPTPPAGPARRSVVIDPPPVVPAPAPAPAAPAAGAGPVPGPDPVERRRSRTPLSLAVAAALLVVVLVGAAVAIGRRGDDGTASAPTTTPPTVATTEASPTVAPSSETTVPTTPATAASTPAPPTTAVPAPGPATAIVSADVPGRVRDATATAQEAANALAAGDWSTARRRIPSLAGASDTALAEAWGALDRSTLVLVDWETDGPETTLRLGQVAGERAGDGARTSLYCVTWTVRGKEVTAMASQQVVAAPWQPGTADPAEGAAVLTERCTGL